MRDLVVPASTQHSPEAIGHVANLVLARGGAPRPEVGQVWVPGDSYPLAHDVVGDLAAVSFAWRDPYPDLQAGWWCRVALFTRRGGEWRFDGGEHDNTTLPTPFERPYVATNSSFEWMDGHSNGGVGEWNDPPQRRTSFFGVVPGSTAALTVSDREGPTRPLLVTPWCGAYVGVVAGDSWQLCGYSEEGSRLGCISQDQAKSGDERLL